MGLEERTSRRVVALAVVWTPWGFFLLTWLFAPGYVGPFLKLRAGMGIVAIAGLGSLFAWWIMQRTSHVAAWVCAILFFVMPVFLIPMLGPATIAILQALGAQ